MIITEQDKKLIEKKRKPHPNTIFVEWRGNVYSIHELARVAPNKLSHSGIRLRINKGMSVEDAVTLPVMPQRERGKFKGF